MTDSEFEAFLEDISHCFLNDDFELWRRRTRIPLCLVLPNENKYLRSEGELSRNFQDCVVSMRIQRVTEIVRRPLSYEVSEDGSILATYETQVFSNGHRLVEPYESAVIMQRVSTGIRACSFLNALSATLSTQKNPLMRCAANESHRPERGRYLN